MPCFLDNIGLGLWEHNKEGFRDMIRYVANHGEEIRGYYDIPYINYHFGDVQMIARTRRDEENHYHVTGLDTHCRGRCIWKLRIEDVLEEGKLDPLYKKLLLKGINGKGLFPAHIVNADVLPSFKKDETIVLQMIAFSEEFHCYRTEEEYELTRPLGRNGQKIIPQKDTLYPIGYFSDDSSKKDEVYIHGTLLGRFNGDLQVKDKKEHYFLKCPVRTQYGCIDIAVHASKLAKETILNMEPGSIIECKAILAGDPAIFQYEKGIIRNPEHNLKLMAYTLENGDPQRLQTVLAESAILQSASASESHIGTGNVLNYIRSIQKAGVNCHTTYTTISESSKNHPSGTRCIIINYANPKLTPGIVFLEHDSNNNIIRIDIEEANDYQYTVDPISDTENNVTAAFKTISYKDRILRRAKHYGIIPENMQSSQVEEFMVQRIQKFNKLTGTLPVRFSESTFANAFLRGLQSDRTKSFNKGEMETIGKQFEHDFRYLTRDEDQPKLLREAVNFTAALGCLYTKKLETKSETETRIPPFLPQDKHLWYEYLAQTILFAYTTGNFEPMIGYLSDDFEHSSLWVIETLNQKAAIDYYLKKGLAIQKGKLPEGKLVKAPDATKRSELCILLKQELDDGTISHVLAVPTFDRNLITRLYITDPKLYHFEEK